MPFFRDRVKEVCTSAPGTGNVTLPGTAPTSYRTFNAAFGTGNPFIYCIVDNTNGLWETGAAYLSASTTMVRSAEDVFDGSSGSGTLVNFTAQPLDVFCTIASHWCEDVELGNVIACSRGGAMP